MTWIKPSPMVPPLWASTEDADQVWLLEAREQLAFSEASSAMELDYNELGLEGPARVRMVLDLDDTEWAEDWLLRPAHEDEHDQVVVYVRYDVVDVYDLEREQRT